MGERIMFVCLALACLAVAPELTSAVVQADPASASPDACFDFVSRDYADTSPEYFTTTTKKECDAMAESVSTLSCTPMRTFIPDATFSASVCQETANSTDGFVVITAKAASKTKSTDIFSIRLAGPELIVGAPARCSNGNAYYYAYELASPGTYVVQVLHLFSNFTYANHPYPNERLVMSEANVTISEANPDACGTIVSTTSTTAAELETEADGELAEEECPACESPADVSDGRWVIQDPAKQAGLSKYCDLKGVRWQCGEDALLVAENVTDSLRWQPYGCSLRQSSAELQNLADRCNELAAGTTTTTKKGTQQQQPRHFCFMGDSQTRAAYFTFGLGLQGKTPTSKNVEAVDGFINAGDAPPTTATTFFWAPWGLYMNGTAAADPTAPVPPLCPVPEAIVDFGSQLTNCTDIVANFGQWHASWEWDKRLKSPMSGSRYASMMDRAAQLLAELQHQGKRVLWLTTFPFPMVTKEFLTQSKDFRTEPVIRLYNEVAERTMRKYRLPVLDSYSIASPLAEMSFDGSHYIGQVGHAVNVAIMQALCGVPEDSQQQTLVPSVAAAGRR